MESERLQESLNNYQAEIDNYKSKMESMKQVKIKNGTYFRLSD